MLKHVVLIKIKDFAEGSLRIDNAQKIKEMLDALPKKIKVIKKLECGINIRPSERAYDLCLIVTFKKEEDLEIYLNHPEHLKIVDFINKVKINIKSVDYEA